MTTEHSREHSREHSSRTARNLKLSTGIFILLTGVLLLLLSCGGITTSVLGAINTEPSATTMQQPGATPTAGQTPTPTMTPAIPANATGEITATPTVTPTQGAHPTGAIATTPSGGPSTTQQSPPPRRKLDAASSATQQFFALALFAFVAILFPAVLLLAFALQQVPRLARNLEDDLEKLGIGLSWSEVESEVGAELALMAGMRTSSGDSAPTVNEVLTLAEYPETNRKRAQSLRASHRGVMAKADELQLHVKVERGDVVKKRYGVCEFLVPLTLLTLFLLATIAWAFWPEGAYAFGGHFATTENTLHTYFWDTIATMPAVLVAMLTAYLFVAYGLVRRYDRSDITPGAYWDAFKRLLVVFLIGLVLTVLFKAEPKPDTVLGSGLTFGAILIGIFAGVFPVHTLQLLSRTGQAKLEQWFDGTVKGKDGKPNEDLAQRLRPRHDLTFLDDMDAWDVERIEQEGVIGIQGMATANIADLVTWTPFPTTQIVDWVDQAILCLAAGAEPDLSHVKTLRAMGLRGASNLVDATKDPAGKLRVVLAAQTLRGTIVEDPIAPAQLAGMRAQLKVKDAQQKVSLVKGRQQNDSTDGIAAAMEAVRLAKWLVDDARDQVKAGGDKLTDALDAATVLHSTFKTISAKADEAGKELRAVTDNKVSESLKTALQALGDKFTEDDAKQAETLVGELDKIAQPLLETGQMAREFQKKAEAIAQKATSVGTAVPTEVGDITKLLTKLTELAQNAKQRIGSDIILSDASDEVDTLVNLLTDDGENKPKKLLSDDRLNKVDQWTAVGDGQKAKAYADAQKLVEVAKQISALVEAGDTAIKKARATATFPSAAPPLTMEILETILLGLEHDPNLRRIHRYLREATAEIVPSTSRDRTNVEWLSSGDHPYVSPMSEASQAAKVSTGQKQPSAKPSSSPTPEAPNDQSPAPVPAEQDVPE
jgi:hypothetical protein